MKEFRCPSCNKLLFKYEAKEELKIEAKCGRCSKVAVLVKKEGEK